MTRGKRHLVVGESIVCLENSHLFVRPELTEQGLWLRLKQTFMVLPRWLTIQSGQLQIKAKPISTVCAAEKRQ